jgi:hypothetical protein
MAATSMKEQGNVIVPDALEMTTLESSSGLLYHYFNLTSEVGWAVGS